MGRMQDCREHTSVDHFGSYSDLESTPFVPEVDVPEKEVDNWGLSHRRNPNGLTENAAIDRSSAAVHPNI